MNTAFSMFNELICPPFQVQSRVIRKSLFHCIKPSVQQQEINHPIEDSKLDRFSVQISPTPSLYGVFISDSSSALIHGLHATAAQRKLTHIHQATFMPLLDCDHSSHPHSGFVPVAYEPQSLGVATHVPTVPVSSR